MRFFPLNKVPRNRPDKIKSIEKYNTALVIILLILTFIVGIFVGREIETKSQPQLSRTNTSPMAFTANRDSCIVAGDKIICIQNNETTTDL